MLTEPLRSAVTMRGMPNDCTVITAAVMASSTAGGGRAVYVRDGPAIVGSVRKRYDFNVTNLGDVFATIKAVCLNRKVSLQNFCSL